MTLEEAIQHAREVASKCLLDNPRCSKDHEELSCFLTDRSRRSSVRCETDPRSATRGLEKIPSFPQRYRTEQKSAFTSKPEAYYQGIERAWHSFELSSSCLSCVKQPDKHGPRSNLFLQNLDNPFFPFGRKRLPPHKNLKA
jgi:hypothetical protein